MLPSSAFSIYRAFLMEIELKLALDPAHAVRLRRYPWLKGIKAEQRALLSLYFDTPDFALSRRGISWRLRRIGYHWVQTLKAAAPAVGALSSRPEWETQVMGNTPDLAVLAPEARARLQGVDLEKLAPVFVTEVKRTTWIVTVGETTMEIALDLGEVRAGVASDPICEIELELKSGPPHGLFVAASNLLEWVPLSIDTRSKAARGYRLAGAVKAAPVKASWPKLDPAQSAATAWTSLVETALGQLVDNLPGFLEQPEEIEYLHQLRVGLRRLMSLARLRPETEAEWIERLRLHMAVLNPARDWDVFLLETLPHLDLPHDPEFLVQAAAMAADARRSAQTMVTGRDFSHTVLQIGQALLTPPDTELATLDWASQVLARRWRVVLRRARGKDEFARHRLRIAVKKLRYACDALATLYGKRRGAAQAHLEALQASLGALNDLAVAERLMHALARAHPECAFSAGRVAGLLGAAARPGSRQRIARELAAIEPFWHKLAR